MYLSEYLYSVFRHLVRFVPLFDKFCIYFFWGGGINNCEYSFLFFFHPMFQSSDSQKLDDVTFELTDLMPMSRWRAVDMNWKVKMTSFTLANQKWQVVFHFFLNCQQTKQFSSINLQISCLLKSHKQRILFFFI